MNKVALIYDWADTNYGGAEKVLLTLQQLYPGAVLFVSFADWRGVPWLKKFTQVQTSFLQKFPRWVKRRKALLAPFLPLAFESFDLKNFDLIISVSSFAAKGVLTRPDQVHVCYLLTPTRFLYSHRQTYLPPWQAFLLQPIHHYLRRWDQVAAWRPDYLIPISHLVARRSLRYYQRPPDAVIYPTLIDFTAFPSQKKSPPDYFLCVSRLVPYKKIDRVITACGRLGEKLIVVGYGPELTKLQNLVKKHGWTKQIKFLQNLDQKSLKMYYNNALALIAPAKEDFGINLLEANAARTLVITHPESGARELLNPDMAIDLAGTSQADLQAAIKQARARRQPLAKRQTYDTNTFTANFVKTVRNFYDHTQSRSRS